MKTKHILTTITALVVAAGMQAAALSGPITEASEVKPQWRGGQVTVIGATIYHGWGVGNGYIQVSTHPL